MEFELTYREIKSLAKAFSEIALTPSDEALTIAKNIFNISKVEADCETVRSALQAQFADKDEKGNVIVITDEKGESSVSLKDPEKKALFNEIYEKFDKELHKVVLVPIKAKSLSSKLPWVFLPLMNRGLLAE